jgi:outer membrane lipoprotein LolB
MKIHYFFVITLFLITSCSILNLKKTELSSKRTLQQQKHWEFTARVAIHVKKESHTLHLTWKKNKQDFDFYLSSSFGVSVAQIIQKNNEASLRIKKDPIRYHKSARSLLKNTLGWDFPIYRLAYWIKGLPSKKGNETIIRGKNNLIKRIQLNEWKVQFIRYSDYKNYTLPQIMIVKRNDLTLKIATKNWYFYP